MLCETSSCYHFNYELLGQQPPVQGKRPLTDQVTNKINSLKQGLKVLLITCFKDLFTMGSFHYRFHNLVSRKWAGEREKPWGQGCGFQSSLRLQFFSF